MLVPSPNRCGHSAPTCAFAAMAFAFGPPARNACGQPPSWSAYLANCAASLAMVFDPITYRAIQQQASGNSICQVRGDQWYNAVLELYGHGKAKRAFPISQEVAVALCELEERHGVGRDGERDPPYVPTQNVYRAVWAARAALPAGYDWVSVEDTCQQITSDDEFAASGPPAQDSADPLGVELALAAERTRAELVAASQLGAPSSSATATGSSAASSSWDWSKTGPMGAPLLLKPEVAPSVPGAATVPRAPGMPTHSGVARPSSAAWVSPQTGCTCMNWTIKENEKNYYIPKNECPELPQERTVNLPVVLARIRSEALKHMVSAGTSPAPPPAPARPDLRHSKVVVVADSTLARQGHSTCQQWISEWLDGQVGRVELEVIPGASARQLKEALDRHDDLNGVSAVIVWWNVHDVCRAEEEGGGVYPLMPATLPMEADGLFQSMKKCPRAGLILGGYAAYWRLPAAFDRYVKVLREMALEYGIIVDDGWPCIQQVQTSPSDKWHPLATEDNRAAQANYLARFAELLIWAIPPQGTARGLVNFMRACGAKATRPHREPGELAQNREWDRVDVIQYQEDPDHKTTPVVFWPMIHILQRASAFKYEYDQKELQALYEERELLRHKGEFKLDMWQADKYYNRKVYWYPPWEEFVKNHVGEHRGPPVQPGGEPSGAQPPLRPPPPPGARFIWHWVRPEELALVEEPLAVPVTAEGVGQRSAGDAAPPHRSVASAQPPAAPVCTTSKTAAVCTTAKRPGPPPPTEEGHAGGDPCGHDREGECA